MVKLPFQLLCGKGALLTPVGVNGRGTLSPDDSLLTIFFGNCYRRKVTIYSPSNKNPLTAGYSCNYHFSKKMSPETYSKFA